MSHTQRVRMSAKKVVSKRKKVLFPHGYVNSKKLTMKPQKHIGHEGKGEDE